jgi:hypothetical protein
MPLSLYHLISTFRHPSPAKHPLTAHLAPSLDTILAVMYLAAFTSMAEVFYRNYASDDDPFATNMPGGLDFADPEVLDQSGFPDRWVSMMDALWVDLVGCVLFALGAAVGVAKALARRGEVRVPESGEWKGDQWCR